MDSERFSSVKKEQIYCSICQTKTNPKEEYKHNSKVLCENCCINIRTPRVRKMHWQYLSSIKTGYLIPANRL